MKRRYRRWTAFLLLGIMLFLEGCAGRKDAGAGRGMPAGTAEEGQDRETGMGRYLEQDVALPEEIVSGGNSPGAYLRRLNNGDLALMEPTAGLYLSSDQGESWVRKPTPWYEELNGWTGWIALAPDGAAALIHSPYKEEEPSSDTDADSEPQAAGKEDPGPESEPKKEDTYLYAEYAPEYFYVDPEGNPQKLEAPDPANWITQFWFGDDSRLYACDLNGKVYEMDTENGKAKELFQIEGVSKSVCFVSRTMLVFTSRDDVVLYDLERGMPAEDQVLQDFVRNHSDSSDQEGLSFLAAAGEQEEVLYLANSGGLYRHVLGGSAMEQLSDGSISSLGDPRMALHGFAVLPDDEFLVLYNGAKLCRYVYDPDIPTVPEEQIHLYSLTEDNTIRQAISLFQKKHPDVYVQYETGLSADGNRTAEDAVKNLNTRILSGSGPDLLVLDGLPARSFGEKGVLADLSGIVHELEGTDRLFKNLVDACRLEGRLYYVPVRFRLPLLVGDRESVERVKDLASLADTVEALREDSPEGPLMGFQSEEEALRILALTSRAAWMDPVNRTIDREKLSEFLENARRIYQAEAAGTGEADGAGRFDWNGWNTEKTQEEYAGEEALNAVSFLQAINVAGKQQKLGAGFTYRMDMEFNVVSTLSGQEEDFAYAPWQGQVSNGFLPKTMVGICAGSEKKETVLEFFRFLYGRKLQDLDLSSGYPINEASFEQWKESPREGYERSGIIISGDSGDLFTLDVRWSRESDFERLRDMARSASVICTGDPQLEEIVCELGAEALSGSADVEKTVDEIVKKASIYLSE